MENEKESLEALQDIRKMMRESSKFLSLSGLSGVFAGVYALIGAYLGHQLLSGYLKEQNLTGSNGLDYDHSQAQIYYALMGKIILICLAVLALSITTAFIMSSRKARKANQSMFDHTSKKLFWSMAVPLFAGGIFCIALILNNATMLVSPVMLLFYGLALLNCSKYTLTDIKYLGYFQILLGLSASFYPGHGLLFWALGFGILHIIYGSIVWFKYDRNE